VGSQIGKNKRYLSLLDEPNFGRGWPMFGEMDGKFRGYFYCAYF
jgi:hypothetical protein